MLFNFPLYVIVIIFINSSPNQVHDGPHALKNQYLINPKKVNFNGILKALY